MGDSLFSDHDDVSVKTESRFDGNFLWHKYFLSLIEAQDLFLKLKKNVLWQQDQIRMYGDLIDVPRLSAWYADKGKSYTYSGIPMVINSWEPILLTIKEKIETFSGNKFNAVLINRYRNGDDSVAWHSDDEPELGRNPIIASLSLGGTRKLMFRHKTSKETEKFTTDLLSGDLLIMKGDLQHQWEHQISKTKKPVGERINLTFRLIKNND